MSNRDHQGLSLLEVLIATTILSFVSLGIVSLTSNGVDTKERVVSEDQDTLQVEAAMLRLENDLSFIYNPLYFAPAPKEKKEGDQDPADSNNESNSEPVGENIAFYKEHKRFAGVTILGHPIPKITSDSKFDLLFMTANHKRRTEDSKESQFAWVFYTLKKHEVTKSEQEVIDNAGESAPAGGTYDLVRGIVTTDIYKNEDIDWDKEKTYVLLSNLESFEFNFWNDKEQKFEALLKELPPTQKMLTGVKVKFKRIAYDGVEIEDERIFRVEWPVVKERPPTVPREPGAEGEGDGGVVPVPGDPSGGQGGNMP